MPIIGIDIEGSDTSSDLLLQACYEAQRKLDGKVVCYTTCKNPSFESILEQVVCADVIHMDDQPLEAVRKKKDYTLTRGLSDLSLGAIDALITCAHTGALTASAVVYLERFPSLHRPALLVELPLREKSVVLLDAGALLSPKAEDLLGFARLGGAFASLRYAQRRPRIGLLNIGKEEAKGTKEVCQADQLLRQWQAPALYVGNIEPYDVLSGAVDVCVCGGLMGNIFLKTVEAAAQIIGSDQLRYEHRAALLAGVSHLLFKCHGEGSPQAISWAIAHAAKMVDLGLISSFKKAFTAFL
jgi:phosphate acyltransferase